MSNHHYLSIKSDKKGIKEANVLSSFLNAPVIECNQIVNSRFLLNLSEGVLSLELTTQPDMKPLYLDFNSRYPSQGKDPLLRAVGYCQGVVVDMTGGWCVDAMDLAKSGYTVRVIEQNRLIYCMVKHAITRY